MNKTAIKNFAIWARVQLIEAAKQRAFEYEITEGGKNDPNLTSVGGRLLTEVEKDQRWRLIAMIKLKGFSQVMEEAAYTWFNRFIALRFLEVNGYLPSKVRVFTDESGAFRPQILKEAMSIELEGLDRGVILDMLDRQDNESLYKYLLIAQCNALSANLPTMFEQIKNWTELLFPANLLRSDSVIGTMISDIPEEDWTDAVQIIGWLYQYYNSELKDETFALLKKNVKITKERIPAATQLFTPDWIVRYMVENSLGRLWYEGHKDFDKSDWKYYLDEAEQEQAVERQLQAIRAEYAQLKPEEIKVIDPCMGSGHILVYAFDVLMQIYTAAGWSERDAAQAILENNLYGLDIDDRAAQLAYFAVMMKARQYDRRALTRGIQPHVYAIQASQRIDPSDLRCYGPLKEKAKSLYFCFAEAKEYGSILKMPVTAGEVAQLREKGRQILEDCDTTFRLDEAAINRSAVQAMDALLDQAELLAQKYDVVVTNPPYMGSSGMSAKLSAYVKDHYPDSKSDLFAVFIERCREMAKPNGYQAMITQHAWMFLSSFEKLRAKLLENDTINMAHLGARAFEEIGGEVVQTTSFVLQNNHIKGYKGTYCRLIDPTTQQGKEDMFLAGENRYAAQQDNFSKIPGAPVAYWVNDSIQNAFIQYPHISSFAQIAVGLQTGDNNLFLRLWHEVEFKRIQFNAINGKEGKWFPYNKGGEYRKWYGNLDYIVNWYNDGVEIKSCSGARPQNIPFYFREGYIWSNLTNGSFSLRKLPQGFIFDTCTRTIYIQEDKEMYIAAFLNSKTCQYLLNIMSPTLHYNGGEMLQLPVASDNETIITSVKALVDGNIRTAKADWDSFETSWDFEFHPLLPVLEPEDLEVLVKGLDRGEHFKGFRLADCYDKWEALCEERFQQLKSNEEELNRIFIDIYGLQDELTPEVEDKDVTVRRADLGRDIRSLISYAVGCMLGRYSLDALGLIFAGGEWNPDAYKTYPADADGILPITDDEYFDDDIVGLFINWVRTVYGAETLEDNLKFIANALGGKGTPREVIRQYFLNDFYRDHLKVYQKRPIYWLFSSGKKNGFKCLVYMHRYQPDLLARIRTDYVHEQQERYRTQLTMLTDSLETAAASQRVKLNKQIAKIKDQALELQKFEEKIHHLADQMIEIDLDDGVKVNYAKFQDVLEKIK